MTSNWLQSRFVRPSSIHH